MTFRTEGFTLAEWQRRAVDAWARGDRKGPGRGTLEIVTGGGKTLIAMACAEHAAREAPDLRLAVVVPTEALARQWRESVLEHSNLEPNEVGLLGAGGSADLVAHRVVISVLNTAAKRLPELATRAQPLMLVVDECHRAGAPTFAKVLKTPAAFRLGLSATPDREELDEQGEPLQYDEQLVGRSLGAVVYRFSLRDARLAGWLPEFTIHHHGIPLLPDERREYDIISRRVDDVADELRGLGFDTGRAQQLAVRRDEVGKTAGRYIAMTSSRKDLLYRARERARVTRWIIQEAFGKNANGRALLFHERVDEATSLYDSLQVELPDIPMALEHSRLPSVERQQAMAGFRSGDVQVLVSVKSLVEGIDVPEADIGISVAATSSVRQRIQALGRVLRRSFGDATKVKTAEMHLLYVADTVDELIYAKEDWADLTGDAANLYWAWTADPAAGPQQKLGPPASPRPTESQEWERLGRTPPSQPVLWEGVVSGLEYTVDTMGNVTNSSGAVISNPQGASAAVEAVRGRPGGRFRVTPEHRLLLVWGGTELESSGLFVAGQLEEAFTADEVDGLPVAATPMPSTPGASIGHRPDKAGGTYKLRQKRGGVIERKAADGALEFASTDGPVDSVLTDNGRRVLAAWRALFDKGISFYLSEDGTAWYLEDGQARLLDYVPGGFAWPATGKGV